MKTFSMLSLVLLFGIYSFAAPPYGSLFGSKQTPTKNSASNFVYAFVRAHKWSKGTNVQWSVTSETGVVGYIVERTYFDPNDPYSEWDQVATTYANGTQLYSAGESSVYPGSVSYRVRAIMKDGSSAISNFSTVWIGKN